MIHYILRLYILRMWIKSCDGTIQMKPGPSSILPHGAICFQYFTTQCGVFVEFWRLAVLGAKGVKQPFHLRRSALLISSRWLQWWTKKDNKPVLTALSFGYLLLGGNVIIETEGYWKVPSKWKKKTCLSKVNIFSKRHEKPWKLTINFKLQNPCVDSPSCLIP